MQSTNQQNQRSRRPLQRVQSADIQTAEAVLKAAMVLIVPDDQTQRKAFESLMPYMYVLRNKGCSWEQLTKLLTDCGFKLQPSTVRTYYGEMLATRLNICQERMNEQILLMAEIRKETKGTDISAISGRVQAMMERQRSMASKKVDSLFGSGEAFSTPAQAPTPREPAMPSREKSQIPGLRPGPVAQHPAEAQPKPASSPAGPTFTDDDAPTVPKLTPAAAHAKIESASPTSEQKAAPPEPLKCKPLNPDVKPAKKRDHMPAGFYQPGALEHPAIPGLMLSLEERLYGAALELINTETAEYRLESLNEKRFRILWRKPIPVTKTTTAHTFTEMDETLFRK